MTCRRWEPTGATRSPASFRPTWCFRTGGAATAKSGPQIDTISTAYPTGRRISQWRAGSHHSRGVGIGSPIGKRLALRQHLHQLLAYVRGNHDSSRGQSARLAYIAENTYGTTPTTPGVSSRSTRPARPGEKDTFQSETIRSDRQLVDSRHGVRQSNGDIGF